MSRSRPPAALASPFEALEARQLLTRPFVMAGFDWGPVNSPVIVVEQGTITPDGIISAAREIHGPVGLRPSGLPAVSRLISEFGVITGAATIGAEPLPTAYGWSLQTLPGLDRQDVGFVVFAPPGSPGLAQTGGVRFFMPLATDATIRDLTGNWRFNELRMTTGGDFTVEPSGNFSLNATTLLLTSSTGSFYSGDQFPRLNGTINTPLINGRADFGSDVRFYLSADYNVILWIDGSFESDGTPTGAIGFAVRTPSSQNPERLLGDYALAFIDAPNAAFTAPISSVGASPLREALIRFNPDGTYAYYDRAFADGLATAPSHIGNWALTPGRVVQLTEPNGAILNMLIGVDYDTLIPVFETSETAGGGTRVTPRFGLAQRFTGSLPGRDGEPPVDPGNPTDPTNPNNPTNPTNPEPPPPTVPETAFDVVAIARSLVPGGHVLELILADAGRTVTVRIVEPTTNARTRITYDLDTGERLENGPDPFSEEELERYTANRALYGARTIGTQASFALAAARFAGELDAFSIDPFLSSGELLDTITIRTPGGVRHTVRVDAITGLVTDVNGLRVGLAGASDTLDYAALAPDGRPILYRTAPDGTVTPIDLFQAAGVEINPARVRSVEPVTDGRTARPGAAVRTYTGVLYILQNAAGDWIRQDLSNLDRGAQIESNLTAVRVPRTDAVGQTTLLLGLDFRGDLILYEQFTTNTLGNPLWQARNIARSQLRLTGQTMPILVSNLEVFVTPWEAIHVAGLDADGQLHVLWWAPGSAHWYASNLSAITGVSGLSGSLSAWVQPWGGMNIAATDADGNLVVHWWAPGAGGHWIASDLTAIADGPTLDPAAPSGIVLDATGSPTIVRMDTDREIVLYTWDRRLNTWAAAEVTRARPELALGPALTLDARIEPDGSFVIIATLPDAEPLRLARAPDASDWTLSTL